MRINALPLALLAINVCIAGCASRRVEVSHMPEITITTGPSMPISAAGHAGGLVDGVPVIAGGSTWSDDKQTKRWLHEVFLLRNGEWVRGPDLPHPLADPAYAHDEKGMYLAGGVEGKAPVRSAWMLSSVAADAKWTPLPPLPIAVDGPSGAIVGNHFYVVGGFMGNAASNRLFSLDLGKPAQPWRELAPLPGAARAFATLTAVDGNLYVFGGFNSPPYQKDVVVYSDAYRYEPAANRWTPLKDISFPGYGWTGIALPAQRVLLVGRVPEISRTSADLWIVDLKTSQITRAGELPSATCCLPAIQWKRDSWLLPGGEPDTNRTRSKTTFVLRVGD